MLMDMSAPQRQYELREVVNALRWLVRASAPAYAADPFSSLGGGRSAKSSVGGGGLFEVMVSDLRSVICVAQGRQGQPGAVVLDGRTLQSSCESRAPAGYDGYKRKHDSKVHMAVDALGHLIAVYVTPADEQERVQVETLCDAVQQVTGETVKLAWADQGYTGENAQQAA